MAKKIKTAKKVNNKINKLTFDENLPQNIYPVGEKVEFDKNIYISQSAYKDIHAFTKNKLTNESGGVLIGNVIEAFGKTYIVIHDFIEAKYSEGTPTTLKFTHETWDYIHNQMDLKYENGKIIGWIHTHPDFGIFLSEYDKFIQNNYFKEEYQIAYVVDPIQHLEGFYFWINGNIERCKGFYIFDKTGIAIEINNDLENENANANKENNTLNTGRAIYLYYFSLAVMVIVIVIAFIWGINLKNRMSIIEKQQENLTSSANQSLEYLRQQNKMLEQTIWQLEEKVDSLEEEIQSLQENDNELIVDEDGNVDELEEQSETPKEVEETSEKIEMNEKE